MSKKQRELTNGTETDKTFRSPTCALLVELGFTFLLDLLNDSLIVLLQKHTNTHKKNH